MISFLRGQIVRKSPAEVVIDVHGVGYVVSIPLSTFEQLDHAKGEQTLLTYMHVREDAMQLFGFATEAERELFRLLISINGIGPKMAQGILSGLSAGELRGAISQGNVTLLTSVPGIGKKTAERIVIELRDKLDKGVESESPVVSTTAQLKVRSEAVVALMSLGHSRAAAEQALRKVLSESTDKNLAVEDLIRLALRHAGK
ncbi:MAG TPA: Holliday junction branch migration protein RuvA [Bacteroidota bacterium]|nr:Holliday junction branch migration protein RuvA [Bacteroidota bacterium]